MLRHQSLLLMGLFILAFASLIFSLSFGPVEISFASVSQCLFTQCPDELSNTVLWQIRLPRVLVGFVAGAGLACAGAILQNTTRNPLADPYLFGIVSGAALGATISTLLLKSNIFIPLPIAAFFGSLLAVSMVFFIATLLQRIDLLLLAGVAVSFMLSSIGQFLLYLGDPFATNRVMFWLMGSLARVDMSHFYIIAPVVLIAVVLVVGFARQIDALLLSDQSAATLGVNVTYIRLMMMAICAALTATIVSYCGGIGFVGLMIPHMIRHIFGVTTTKLVIGSCLIGGCFLVWVDVFARSALAEVEIPIGIITAAIGSVFFLFIMLQNKKT